MTDRDTFNRAFVDGRVEQVERDMAYIRRDITRHRRRLLSDLLAFGFVVVCVASAFGLAGVDNWAILTILCTSLGGVIYILARWL